MPNFSARGLYRLGRDVLLRLGCNEAEAHIVADHLVRSNLAGHDSHGIGVLPGYVRRTQAGLFVPNQTLRKVLDFGALLQFDAGRGFGQRMIAEAIEQGIGRARDMGVCLVGIRNTSHLGRVGTYAELCSTAGCAFIAFVNVADHTPMHATYGAREPRLGTNPFCAAVPGEDGPALMLDVATTMIAANKARIAYEKGLPAPDDTLIDIDGRPTTDPTALIERHEGALVSFGRHKGSGLAVMCEAMGAVLTGGQRADEPFRDGVLNSMLAIIIDTERLDGASGFSDGFAAVAAHVKSAQPAAGFERVLLPGEPERLSAADRSVNGIPMSDGGWTALRDAALGVGLSDEAIEKALADDGEGHVPVRSTGRA